MLTQGISKKQFGAVAVVLLALAAAVSLAVFSPTGVGSNLKSAFSRMAAGAGLTSAFSSMADSSDPKATTAQKFLAMFDARSPGERTRAELAATKLRKASVRKLVANVVPTQRALGKVIQPKSAPSPQFVNAITPAPLNPAVPQGLAELPLGEVLAPVPASFTPVVGGLLIPPIGGGGGGSPGSPTAPGIVAGPIVGVTPAVPEPSTWLMMLFGFGAIGSALRRRGAVAVAVPAKA